ncbi:DUF4326 domain-containing protein [Maricaulis sp.]|uniref:DUF4326 domain-containing protein n=1 Tax=Maricaulis sp. TaxID=1486257 RepID=UPI003A8F2338
MQLRRTRGWRKPADAVVVTRATRWGNPYRVEHWGVLGAVNRYRKDLVQLGYVIGPKGKVTVEEIRAALRGRPLACFCKLCDPCHADVTAWVANSTGSLAPKRHVSGGMGIGERRSPGTAVPDPDPLPGRDAFTFILDEGVGR